RSYSVFCWNRCAIPGVAWSALIRVPLERRFLLESPPDSTNTNLSRGESSLEVLESVYAWRHGRERPEPPPVVGRGHLFRPVRHPRPAPRDDGRARRRPHPDAATARR